MYHDEFAKRPVRRESSFGENALPTMALEVGGGLWMVLAASLNQTISSLLFQIGGLLPLVACSCSIFAHRCSESLSQLARTIQTFERSPLPIPHLSFPSSSASKPRRTRVRAESARAGFDHSSRLG